MDNAFQLCQLLCGDFCNREQAFNNPPIYAHIQVRIRALPHLEPGSLLLEQAYTVAPNEPYRIRVLQVVVRAGAIQIINKAIKDEQAFIGAASSIEKLLKITEPNLITLEGCTYNVTPQNMGYEGLIEPGCKCIVTRNGICTYLDSYFVINKEGMSTLDRGYNVDTNQLSWGSLAGPFQFKRHMLEVPPPPIEWQNNLGGN